MKNTVQNLKFKIQNSDIDLMRKSGVSEDDIGHCVKVAEKALEIAVRTGAVLFLVVSLQLSYT